MAKAESPAQSDPADHVYFTVDSVTLPLQRKLLALWEERRGGHAMPARADISVRDMKDYLRHIHLYEVLNDGEDFLIRVVGTELTWAMGFDPTGKRLSEIPNAQMREGMLECVRRVLDTAAPARFVSARGSFQFNSNKGVDRLMLPLGTGGKITHVLGIVVMIERGTGAQSAA
jgi:hypothetical protein